MVQALIRFERDGEWSYYTLQQRPDGLWRYERESRIQGTISGRVVVLEAPAGLQVEDEADLDTLATSTTSKADQIIHNGREVRCLRRGQAPGGVR